MSLPQKSNPFAFLKSINSHSSEADIEKKNYYSFAVSFRL